MSRSQSFLSRPPRVEPPLHSHSGPGTAHRRSALTAPRATPHSGRSGTQRRRTDAEAEIHVAARPFAEYALRLTLEVVDRRRPPQQLRACLEPNLIDSVRVLANSSLPGRALGSATLERIHLTLSDPTATGSTSADVFGSYARGNRIFAIAAHVTRGPGDQGWRVTSLRIG